MFYSQSVSVEAFRAADRSRSYMCIFPHTYSSVHAETHTHTHTLSLVEPLNGGPLTAIQSQSPLAENR